MVFLPIFLFAAYAHLILSIRGLVSKGRDALIAHTHFVVCLVGALALLLGFELVPDPRKGIAGNAYNWCVVAFFAFGSLTVIMFAARLPRLAREGAQKDRLSLRFGTTLLAVLAGLYVCGTVVDHWLFFRDFQKSGVAEASFVGHDVKCDTSVLVRFKGDTAIYRCPTLVEFGRDYRQPFVPWPSYRQGETDGRPMLRELAADAEPQIDPRSATAVLELPAGELRISPAQCGLHAPPGARRRRSQRSACCNDRTLKAHALRNG
jgi:hypothetical protein